ncbi:hypothetical protein [Sandaracinus amylolyticus]|uniref:hypothetical protein n=1 Tax=Sandaracinus amylolyticus TaxID=927083 RepID=UPI001F2C4AF7|nr:hypothetical protein [Sandaracinus amylolyticus]UJR86508.1 Hypothetical protein I5071_86030 [Sandaracinus amylolyticus]
MGGGGYGTQDGALTGVGVAGPLAQAKLELHPTSPDAPPGVALVGGAIAPSGAGAFERYGWSAWGYLALTQSFFAGDLRFDMNVGVSTGSDGRLSPLFGLAFRARIYGVLGLAGEVATGDALDRRAVERGSVQLGPRLILSDKIEIDATFGTTFPSIEAGWWVSCGIRFRMPRLYDPQRAREEALFDATGRH